MSQSPRPLGLLLAAFGLLALPAGATTIAPVADEALLDEATLVVEGSVRERREPRQGPYTDYAIDVARVVKGELVGRSLTLRVLGGPTREGPRLLIWGAPQLQVGEPVLLFLGPRRDGTWGLQQFTLGAFRGAAAGGRLLARRDLSGVNLLPNGEERAEAGRDFAAFSRWLADRARGLRRAADYFVDDPGARAATAPFTYIAGFHVRWFEFDEGRSVTFLAHQDGQPLLPSAGFAPFQAALEAWNDERSTNIRYRYGGTTANSTGFDFFDRNNTILFTDFNDEVEGTFTCSFPGSGSGVLAIGGPWFDDESPAPHPIAAADVVVNDGAGCWFITDKRAEQVYGHELGHTLGLGHSCGDARSGGCDTNAKDEALMRARAHGDNRGASFSSDDIAGIVSLYGDGAGGSKPAAPTQLAATATSPNSIDLVWTDNATDETVYQVERKTGAGNFQKIQDLPADAEATTVNGLLPGTTYTFRVRARRDGTNSGYSNQASVKTPQAAPPAAPTNLTATPLANGTIQLAWQDKSSDETSFRIEMSSPTGGFVEVADRAADATNALIGSLAPDTPYTFRVRARNAIGNSAFSNQASATTAGATAPCVADGETLCLQNSRFRVRAQWRNGGNHGQAGAVPLAGGESGMFWFFSADNVEVIVKILDANPINSFFWTFYGGLSSVEYWISVTDTTTLASRTYHNPPGEICGGVDTKSLPGPSGGPAATAAPALVPSTDAVCAPGTLCLLGGRFQVEVTWTTPSASGVGTPVPISGSDATGLFWFFSAQNIELVLKVLDGTPVNGHYWVFYGALSDVAYTIKVTDTQTGAVRTYSNAAGNVCGRADTEAF
jgi:hypothetical protein